MKPTFDKKRQMAEQILKVLEGQPSKDNKYTINEIELMVEQQYAYQIKVSLFSSYKVGEAINPGQYVVTFEDVPVKTSITRKRDYIDLPARFVDLPGGRGLWSIGPMGNDYDKFIPLKLGSANFSKVYNVPFLQDNVGFELEGLRAYFTKDLIVNNLTSCLVQLVTPADPNFNIPADFDMSVIQGVLTLLGIEKEPDNVSDNNEAR